MCAYNNDEANVFDTTSICASNAHVPTFAETMSLLTFLGDASLAGGKLKAIDHWNTPNVGATDEYLFHAVGGGQREWMDGSFNSLKESGYYWIFDQPTPYAVAYFSFSTYNSTFNYQTNLSEDHGKIRGWNIRLIIDSPIEIVDNLAIYVGNDLRRYKCTLINGVWWLAENLAETKWRNGDLIPNVTDNTEWIGLITGAQCIYDNDIKNL